MDFYDHKLHDIGRCTPLDTFAISLSLILVLSSFSLSFPLPFFSPHSYSVVQFLSHSIPSLYLFSFIPLLVLYPSLPPPSLTLSLSVSGLSVCQELWHNTKYQTCRTLYICIDRNLVKEIPTQVGYYTESSDSLSYVKSFY